MEKLPERTEWLVVEDENYVIINGNEVDYILDNGYVIKVKLDLYYYARKVEIYDDKGKLIDNYEDLSKERIVDKIRQYETY